MNFLLTLLILLFILGFIVFFHELGHFLMAKKAGVYVDEFSVGMGPKILSFKRKKKKDPTTYSLRALPIGGYVAMASVEAEGFKVKKSQVLANKKFYQKMLVLFMGIIFNFILALALLFLNGWIYGSPVDTPYIGDILENSAVDRAGFETGDLIVKIDGKKVTTWDDVLLMLNVIEGDNNFDFEILKEDGRTVYYNVSPDVSVDEEGEETRTFGFAITSTKEYGFINAVKYSCKSMINITKSLFVIIGNLFTGGISVNNLSGPVGVFTVIDQIKSSGLESIIYLIAYLSLNVGIINLIPVPVFDGGRILIEIIEKIIGRKLNDKFSTILNYIGFGLLLILMLYVTFNDILKLF